MPRRRPPAFYWDTSVFILALEGQGNYPAEALVAAAQIVDLAEIRKVTIVTSQIVVTEVLPSRAGEDGVRRLRRWLQWQSLMVLAVDTPVVERAAQLRDKALRLQQKRWLGDLLHVATALTVASDLEAVHSMDADVCQLLKLAGCALPCHAPRPVSPQLLLPSAGEEAAEEAGDG
ncbi:MAG: PIN domain-containing protein [Armatimonadetes bacterium]|nr:PIN domain-containing protein [Armatimonadota bacterium]